MTYSFHPRQKKSSTGQLTTTKKSSPLGYDFAIEVYAAIQRSIAYPKAWTVLEGEVRRSLVRRFPYGILYSEEKRGCSLSRL